MIKKSSLCSAALTLGLWTLNQSALAGPYQVFPAKTGSADSILADTANPKPVAVLVHGLNLRPERMDDLAVLLSDSGVTVVRVSLTGHQLQADGTRQSMNGVTLADWTRDLQTGIDAAKKIAAGSKRKIVLAGFSLGGALIWHHLATAIPASATSGSAIDNEFAPERVVLIAPAVAPVWFAQASRILGFMPNLMIPSLSPSEYRAHMGTTIGGYSALLSLVSTVKESAKINGSYQVTVIANPDDELVSFEALNSPPLNSQFLHYELIRFKKEITPAISKLPRHLMVDRNSMSAGDWEKFSKIFFERLTGEKFPVMPQRN